MQGLLFPYSRPSSHSCFSYYWGFQNHSCSNSRLPTWFLQLSPGWHIRFKSDSPSACPRILLLELSHKNLGSATSHLFFRICIGSRFATELVSKLPRLLSECSNLSSHPIFHLSSQDMCRREHSALLRASQYTFLHVKPPLQLPNHFHLLLQIFGMLCQTICLPFQLFLLLEELSNITYSSSLTPAVVQNLARSSQLNVSHFVIQRQLLLLRCPETPCRPYKGVPSERLRLAEVINFP